MKSRHFAGVLTGVVLGVSLTATIIGCASSVDSKQYLHAKLSFLGKELKQSYLRDIDNAKVNDSIYAGYVSGLEDPATAYLSEERLKEQQALEQGKYMGTGLQFEWGLDGRYIIITDIIPNSPAAKANLKIGDKITLIDHIKVMLSNETELYEKLMYKGNESVTYTVKDNDGSNQREVSLTSKIIDVKSMSSKMIEKNIGYITVFSIKDGASKEMEKNLKALKLQGAKKFIIDIRNASSNNIEEVYKMSSLFINNKTVFKVQNKEGKIKEYKTAKAPYTEQLTVLINNNTKAALEAFAAAVKTTNRGKVIGEKSAGIGRVSQIIKLADKTGVMVTTGIIYTSDGNTLKDKGVVPTTEIKNSPESIIELLTKGKLEEKNDSQLMEAVKQLR